MPTVARIPLLSAGIPGLAYLLNEGGLQCATVVAAAATATATEAAVSGTEHCFLGFEFAIYDANIGADGYVHVEVERDSAAAGGGATSLFETYYDWDFSVDIVVIRKEFWLPAPLITGTSGETLDLTVTTGLAADAVTANIFSIPIVD
jgi:hypothetical protein